MNFYYIFSEVLNLYLLYVLTIACIYVHKCWLTNKIPNSKMQSNTVSPQNTYKCFLTLYSFAIVTYKLF